MTLAKPPHASRRWQDELQRKVLVEYLARHERRAALEADIRHTLGNTPSISKALRSAVRTGMVVREGGGGRKDPFTYRRAERRGVN